MNINQINALRKIASAHASAEAYGLDKEAAFNAQALKAAFGKAKGAITGAAKRTTNAFRQGGFKGGMTSLKRQGVQAGRLAADYAKKGAKFVGDKWNNLSPMAQAGVAAGVGGLGALGLSAAASGNDEEETQPVNNNFRYR